MIDFLHFVMGATDKNMLNMTNFSTKINVYTNFVILNNWESYIETT